MSDSAETMTLEIEFAGMCLFVHDGETQYVLLPTVAGGTAQAHNGGQHATHPPHLARLFYDQNNLDCKASTVVPTPGNEPSVPLRNDELRFRSSSSDAHAVDPDDIWLVNLSTDHPRGKVLPDLLTNPVHEPLAARIVLSAGYLDLKPYIGAWWKYGTLNCRPMAVSGYWRISDVPAPLTLELNAGTLVLRPTNGVLKIHIFNATDEETPHSTVTTRPGMNADHFVEFGKLLTEKIAAPPTTMELPKYEPSRAPVGRLFTCIMAEAEVEEGTTATAQTT